LTKEKRRLSRKKKTKKEGSKIDGTKEISTEENKNDTGLTGVSKETQPSKKAQAHFIFPSLETLLLQRKPPTMKHQKRKKKNAIKKTRIPQVSFLRLQASVVRKRIVINTEDHQYWKIALLLL
jgi:hypothetical protein